MNLILGKIVLIFIVTVLLDFIVDMLMTFFAVFIKFDKLGEFLNNLNV